MDDLMEKGNAKFRRGDYQGAIADFTKMSKVRLTRILNWAGGMFKERDIGPPRLAFRLFCLAYRIFPWLGCKGAEWEFVLSRLPALCGGKVLVADIGGGLSLLPFEIARRGYGVTVYDQIEFKRRGRDVRYVRGDILGIGDGGYDVVLCISVIEHIGLGMYGDAVFADGPMALLKKMAGMLKIGGILILTTPHLNYPIESDRKFTFAGIMEMISKCGMKVVHSDLRWHQIMIIAERTE